METRSKKPAGNQDTETRDLATRQFELEAIEKAMQERERRINQIETAYEQRAAALELDKRNFERERKQITIRLDELSLREREMEKRWQDFEIIKLNETAANLPKKIKQSSDNYIAPPPTRNENFINESPTPKVSFREATDSVPYFDGYNIPLAQFTRACRRAREIIPPSGERNLTKLLINKLSKRAYYAVEDEPCNTVTDLIDLLTDAFGTAKTLDQYRGELSIIYLKPKEHILDYISRVKDLRISILDAERRNRRELDERFIIEIDDLTARSFYQGLPLEYRLQINPITHPQYTDMFAAAKTIAKHAELDKQRSEIHPRYDKGREARPFPINRPPQNHNYDNRNSYNYENKYREPQRNVHREYRNQQPLRHETRRDTYTERRDTPPMNRYTDRRDAPPTSRYEERRELGNKITRDIPDNDHGRNNRPNLITCQFCKNFGHSINECRKRQYAERQKERSGNLPGPSGYRNPNPTDGKTTTKPMNVVKAEESESEHAQNRQ